MEINQVNNYQTTDYCGYDDVNSLSLYGISHAQQQYNVVYPYTYSMYFCVLYTKSCSQFCLAVNILVSGIYTLLFAKLHK